MSSINEDGPEVPQGRTSQQQEQTLGELLAQYWRLVRNYYWLILLACIATLAASYAWTKYQTKVYQASSKIVYHNSQGNIFGQNIEQVELLNPGGHWQFEQFWHTQKQVLQARWFLERVVKRQGLLNRDGFLSDPKDGSERSDKEAMDAAVNKVDGMVNVHLQRDSRVGVVSVKSSDPELSKIVANGMAEAYVEYTQEFQSGGLKQITNWFDQYVATKREELEQAQAKLQNFKKENNILSLSYEERQNLTAKNMESVNEQLVEVRGELSSEEALLNQIKEMENSGEDLKAVADMVDSDTLNKLFERESKLEQEKATLKSKYGDKHPKVRGVTQGLETVRDNIRREIDRVRASVANRVSVLRRNESNLETQLKGLKEEVFDLNELGVKYGQLKDRAENLEELYNTVLKRSSELDINSLYQSNDIEVLEHAEKPNSPVSPSLPVNLALGLVLGLGLGAGGAIVLDTLDTTIKSEEDVTEFLDKPILAMLPKLNSGVLRGLETIGESPADTITHTAPKSSFAESIKTLRTNLSFMSPDDPPKTLLVTSPGPSEGKTLTSVNLAIAMAQSGQRTLLIDTDLRRPRMHKALALEKKSGVTAIVSNDDSFEAQVQPTVTDGLDAMTCGDLPPNPSELLHSQKFADFVQDARSRYDRVIFDSPPLAAVSDALVISQAVDGVLLVVEFAQTRRETLRHSLEQLRGIGAPLLGVVFNEVSQQSGGYKYDYYRYEYYGEDPDEELGDSPSLAS